MDRKKILTQFLTDNNVKHAVFNHGTAIMLIELGIVIPLKGDIQLSEQEWLKLCVHVGEKNLVPVLENISKEQPTGKVIKYDFQKEGVQ